MGKDKKEKKDKTPSKAKEDSDGGDGELRPVCAIAKPLADIGFHKKILKVVKKGATRPARGKPPIPRIPRSRTPPTIDPPHPSRPRPVTDPPRPALDSLQA